MIEDASDILIFGSDGDDTWMSAGQRYVMFDDKNKFPSFKGKLRFIVEDSIPYPDKFFDVGVLFKSPSTELVRDIERVCKHIERNFNGE